MPTSQFLTDLRPSQPSDTLLYYDGPLLHWLPVEGRRLLAIALLEPVEGHDAVWPFLVCEMTEQGAQALLNDELTLLGAVLSAEGRYLLPNYGAEVMELIPVECVPEDWLPGDAFLSPIMRPL